MNEQRHHNKPDPEKVFGAIALILTQRNNGVKVTLEEVKVKSSKEEKAS